MTFWKWNRPE